MDSRRLRLRLAPAALGLLQIGFALGWELRSTPAAAKSDAEAIATAALLSVRNSGRVVAFSARFVFALPLRAACVEASVAVRFVDPAGKEEATFLDRPRPLQARLRDRSAER